MRSTTDKNNFAYGLFSVLHSALAIKRCTDGKGPVGVKKQQNKKVVESDQ